MIKMHSEETKLKIRKQKTCKGVICFNRFGIYKKEYKSISEAAREMKISRTAIVNALKYKSGVHLSGWHIWRYTSDFTPEHLDAIRKEAEIFLTSN